MTREGRRNLSDQASLQSVAQAAARLSQADKEELIAILQAMLALDEKAKAQPEEQIRVRQEYHGPKGGKGYYEQKMINNCGPYLYLRYWSSGKHRSVYLGKVKP
jgi:hypothetical protein